MTVTKQWGYSSPVPTQFTAEFDVPDALTAGDVYVALDLGNYAATSEHGTAVTGLGVTWSRVAAAQNGFSEVWVGTGASSLPAGEHVALTGPALSLSVRRTLAVFCFRGVSATVAVTLATATSATATTADMSIGLGQAALAFGYSDTSADALKSLVPGTGWATITSIALFGATRYSGVSNRIPTTTENHKASASRSAGVTYATMVRLGDLDTPPTPLVSTFAGWGTPIF